MHAHSPGPSKTCPGCEKREGIVGPILLLLSFPALIALIVWAFQEGFL